jgi:hypothetical protein
MHRRTLDIIFSAGALALAGLLLILGLVLQNQADFAKNYVHDQLSAQKIVFTPTKTLAPEEKKADCLVKYGTSEKNGKQDPTVGQPLTKGKQAECYANEYIALHLTEINEGKTYAETSTESRAAATEAATATTSGAANAAQLTATAKALDGKTQTLFRGETLRGLLLTSYGFSIFGERAQQAALVCFAVALVLLLASIAGFVHAFSTSKEKTVNL